MTTPYRRRAMQGYPSAIKTTCNDCGEEWDGYLDLTEHKARWCHGPNQAEIDAALAELQEWVQ